MSHSSFTRDCEFIYTHLTELRKTLSQDELLARFQALFIIGQAYPQPEVLAALYSIVTSPLAETHFPLFLNRCCYILINYWWSHPGQSRGQGTAKLVQQLESSPMCRDVQSAAYRLNQLVRQFAQLELFTGLCDRARAEQPPTPANPSPNPSPNLSNLAPQDPFKNSAQISLKTQPEADLDDSADDWREVREEIHRYPFLYSHLLAPWDSSEEGKGAIRQIQRHREKQFEDDLHRYCLALRRQRPHPQDRSASCSALPQGGGWDGQWGASFCKNPTRLGEHELQQALWHYTGKAFQNRTAQDRANDCRTTLLQAKTFLAAKQHLYTHLSTLVDAKYSQHRFQGWLKAQIEAIQPQCDRQVPRPQLLMQLCGDLLAALLANPNQNRHHHIMFVDFNTNLGAVSTVGFVLQILLICRGLMREHWGRMKSYVSGLFAQLFRHYQSVARRDVEWLMHCLEHVQVAFAIHSERTDFAWLGRAVG
jgi:hypothetical protein